MNAIDFDAPAEREELQGVLRRAVDEIRANRPPTVPVDAWQEPYSQTAAPAKRKKALRRIATLAAAAVALAGVWLGISHFAADGHDSSAFAQVLEDIQKAKTVTWKTTFYMRYTSKDGKRTWLERETRQCEYKSPGLYREVALDEKGKIQWVETTDATVKPQRQLTLCPAENEATLSVPARDPQDPRGPFEWVKNKMEDADLQWVESRQTANGTVNIFRHSFQDKVNGGDWSYDFWIDQKTKRLVEFHVPGADIFDYPNEPDRSNPPEKRFSTGTALAHAHHDIVFNTELDDSLFSLEPPKGYTVKTEGRRRLVAEKEMIDYLGVVVDFNGKTFPDTLFPGIPSNRVNEAWYKPEKDRTAVEQKLIETKDYYMRHFNQMPTSLFLEDHAVQNSFRYLGKGVKLGDTDRIVCWYKLKDAKDPNTLRVVYGDLTVKDVAAEDLPLPVEP